MIRAPGVQKTGQNQAVSRANVSEVGSSRSSRINAGKEPVFCKHEAYRSLARLVVKLGESPKIVKDVYFRAILLYPQCHYKVATLSRYCLKLYEEQKEIVKRTLRSLESGVCLSTERLYYNKFVGPGYFPSSDNEVIDYNYACLKVHFVDENWHYREWIISYTDTWTDDLENLAEGDAAGKSVEKGVQRRLELGIEDKVFAVTENSQVEFDYNADVIRSCVKEHKSLPLSGKFFRLECCGDVLCSMVKGAFSEVDNIINMIKLISPWPKSEPLWHITLHNLRETLDNESNGEYLNERYEGYDIPRTEEWEKVRAVCKLVGYVYDAAEVLFETNCATASIFLYNLQNLRSNLKKEAAGSESFLATVAGNMLEKFEKYWNVMFLVLAVCTVMDPRCKMKYIEFSCLKYEGSNWNLHIASVKEATKSLYMEFDKNHTEEHSLQMSDSSSCDTDSEEELSEHRKKINERRRDSKFVFGCLDEYNQFMSQKASL